MFCRNRKGLGTMLTALILIIVVGIAMFLFFTLFTYRIRVATTQSITKSKDSLILLSVTNQKYKYGENFVLAISNATEETSEEILEYIVKFNEIDATQITSHASDLSVYYYFDFGIPKKIYYVSNGKCYDEPLKCKDYTYVMRLPIPILYDGTKFLREGIFISFV